MKDFKNENEYGNMKLENETYEHILLKTGDVDYRYYSSSSSNSSTSSTSSTSSGGSGSSSSGSSSTSGSSGVGSYDCSYCLDTGLFNGSACPHCINIEWGCESSSSSDELITLNITATCGNCGNITVELYGAGATGTIVSQSASSNRVEASGQIEAGTYTIVVWAYLNTGELRSKEEIIVVKNANSDSASDYNCAYCKNTGLVNVNDKVVCTHCDEGNAYITPIRFAHNYSKQPSGYEMDFAALCEEGWNMYINLYNSDKSTAIYSRGTSAGGIAGTYYPLGEGRYIVEAKAITENGFTRTQEDIIEITEADAHPEYPEGFSYTVNSYDKDNETCNVTMVARYKDAPGTYLDIVSVDGSTEEIVANDYRDGSLAVITEEMLTGDYIAKTNINYVNCVAPRETVTFNVDAQEVDLALTVTNKSFDETMEECCLEVSVCASSSNYLNNLKIYLYDENGEELLDTSEEDNCEFSVSAGTYRLKVESSCTGNTYFYGNRYVQFDVEKSTVGHELSLSDIPTTNAPGGGGSTGGDDSTDKDDTTTTPEVEDVPDNERKFLLLYTGPNLFGGNYPEFTCVGDNNDIQKLKECGATDFVLTTAAALNYDMNEKQIIGKIDKFVNCTEYEDYSSAYSEYNKQYEVFFSLLGIDETTEKDAKALHKRLWGLWGENNDQVIDFTKEEIDEDEYNANPHLKIFTGLNFSFQKEEQLISIAEKYNFKRNYKAYADSVAELAKHIVEKIPTSRLWIGLPPMLPGAYFLADRYETACFELLKYIKSRSDVADTHYWDNVVGIYYGTEDIPPGYVEFEKDNVKDNFNCPVVETMRWLKETCLPEIDANKNMRWLWIPYYRDFADNSGYATGIPERIGSVVNKTDIFDFVIIQPSYYFKEEHKSIVSLVKQCVIEGKCVKSNYSWGNDIWVKEDGYSQVCEVTDGINRAIVGAEMEVNEEIDTDTNCLQRYNVYEANFNEFITGTGESGKKAPIAFYVDDRDSLMNTSVYQRMKDFFAGNIVVTESND